MTEWTPEDDDAIRQGVVDGLEDSELAEALGCSPEEAHARRCELGLWKEGEPPARPRRRPWSDLEIETLRFLRSRRLQLVDIAQLMQRTRSAVSTRVRLAGIPRNSRTATITVESNKTYREQAEEQGVPTHIVAEAARRQGLSRRKPWRKWSPEDDLWLLELKGDGLSASSIAKTLERTERAIHARYWQISHEKVSDGEWRVWTDGDDATLRGLYALGARDDEIAEKLDRTPGAVFARRFRLRLVRGEAERVAQPAIADEAAERTIPPGKIGTDLKFGPYTAPDVQPGDILYCEFRLDDVIVGGFTDLARIPWPRVKKTGRPSLILCGDLVRAVQMEAEKAICHHWDVGATTVWKWRQALGIGRINEGTAQLYRELAPQKLDAEARARGREAVRSPASRAKISATKRGKPAEPGTRKALLEAAKRPKSKGHRRAIAEGMRQSGHRPRDPERPDWTLEEDDVIRQGVVEGLTDREIAERVGRSFQGTRSRRQKLGLSKANRS